MVLIKPTNITWEYHQEKKGFWVNKKWSGSNKHWDQIGKEKDFTDLTHQNLEKSWTKTMETSWKILETSGFGSQKTKGQLLKQPIPCRSSPPSGGPAEGFERHHPGRSVAPGDVCAPFWGVWLFLGVGKIPEVNFWYFWENPPRYFWCGSFWGNSPRGHWGDYSAEKSVSHSKPFWSSTILVAGQYWQGQNVLHLKTCELWNLAVLGISEHETCEKHGETYGKECGAI